MSTETYREGQTIILRTQFLKHADNTYHTHFYTEWHGFLSCEGSQTVTLSEYEADRLNDGRSFWR